MLVAVRRWYGLVLPALTLARIGSLTTTRQFVRQVSAALGVSACPLRPSTISATEAKVSIAAHAQISRKPW
jgi:hypothetical protein